MVNVELPKIVEGDILADVVESAMNELDGFEVTKKSSHRYDINSKLVETHRFIKARKKYGILGPLIDRYADLTWSDPNKRIHLLSVNPMPIFYIVPLLGQVLYVMNLLNPYDGKCLIGASIDLDKKYKSLDIMVWGRGYEQDIAPENVAYEYFKTDVEHFIYRLNQRLRF